ncbi:MAG: CotH kinase family protein [Bacteroidales bacterium]|nr:CotH kinase family protein [Bacteroidales bacterium]
MRMKRLFCIFLIVLAAACGKDDLIIVDDGGNQGNTVVDNGGDGNGGGDENGGDNGNGGGDENGGSGENGGGGGQEGNQPPEFERFLPVLPASGTVPEIRITISESEWEKLLAAFNKDSNTQEYISCDVDYSDGTVKERVARAGLRLKGNTSRRYPGEAGHLQHVHFGLHFSEYVKGQKLLGTSRLDLKWFKDDAAYCREVFCYDLFQRAGIWTAISAGYTRLWIKIGEKETYMGVYILMEHVRGDYLKRRETLFGGRDGHLWKGRWGGSLKDPNGWMGADDNKNNYTYELKSDETDFAAAKAQLQDFIRKLNSLKGEEFYAWAEQKMDVPLLLRTYAVNVLVGMWDDYWTSGNNYYFYFNPAGRFYFIPYDYDNTLGTSLYYDSGRQNPLHWGDDKANPLIAKLLARDEWREYYVQCLKDLCAGDFQADTAMARISSWHKAISGFVSNDTGQDMTIADRPASWGNHAEYRILSPGNNNFFSVKASVVDAL